MTSSAITILRPRPAGKVTASDGDDIAHVQSEAHATRWISETTKGIEEFKVTVIGVLENVGPLQSMILAKLEGGPLAETGVIAGMSGSPVFIDGKLVGAVAYGFPFSKETIGGITPIAEMIDATKTDAPLDPWMWTFV